MKKTNFFFLLLATILLIASSCEALEEDISDPSCKDIGYLRLTNGSLNTIQMILIDGTNYGTLDPGDTGTYTLGVGRHDFQFKGVNGSGCAPASVVIAECKTESRICRN